MVVLFTFDSGYAKYQQDEDEKDWKKNLKNGRPFATALYQEVFP